MHRLDGKKAVITAAAQGMGRAIAEAFADEGATVYASDINENKIHEISSKNKILTTVCDVTDNNSIEEFLDFSGTPDILFNCAGFVAEGTILDATEEEWDKSFNINVKSMFRMIKTFLPSMINVWPRRGWFCWPCYGSESSNFLILANCQLDKIVSLTILSC